MNQLANYVYAWNDWVVMPILLLAAIYAFIRFRKPSTLVFAFGVVLYIASSLAQIFYPSPLNLIHSAALVSQFLGLLVGLGGFAWFWRKDRNAKSMQAGVTLDRGAR